MILMVWKLFRRLFYTRGSGGGGGGGNNEETDNQMWFRTISFNFRERSKANAFHIAAINDDDETMRQLVTGWRIGINRKNPDGNTALTIAIENRNTRIIKLLLDAGAKHDCTHYNSHYGPLHMAAKQGYLEAVKLLLEAGADVNACDKSANSPLHLAVSVTKYKEKNERRRIAAMLLKEGAKPDQLNKQGETPLHLAITKQYFEIAAILIDAGANVRIADAASQTPLHLCVREQHIGLTQRLVEEKRADVNIVDGKEMSPLCYAMKAGNLEIAKLLSEHGALTDIFKWNFDPLFEAINNRDIEKLDFLLKVKPDINLNKLVFDTEEGLTYVQIAAKYGHTQIVEKLIEHGANVRTASWEGCGILRYAADMSHKSRKSEDYIDLLELLICEGAGKDLSLSEISDILSLISPNVDAKTLRYFVEHLIDFTDYSLDDAYKILYLVMEETNDGRLFKMLADNGKFKINNIDKRGHTALHFISDRPSVYSPACLTYVLKKGIYVNLQSRDGKTPLHLAVAKGNYRCVQLLLYHGADVNSEDCKGNLVLGIAVRRLSNVLSSSCSNYEEDIVYCIIRHIAILEFLKKPVSDGNYGIINTCQELRELYKECQQELKYMQEFRIDQREDGGSGGITLFDLLVNAKELSRNSRVIEFSRSGNTLDKCEIYCDIIIENLGEIRKRGKLVEAAQQGLQRILVNFDVYTFAVISNVVFEYLSNKDLQNLSMV